MLKIKRVLVSVSDKAGIVDFARVLAAFGVEILSTGGTARTLKEAGLAVTEVADYTCFPEMLDGRVKTLHPKIHAGLLARRDDALHMRTLRQQGIGLIDMVVVNLYPFENAVSRPGVSFEEAVENIDIGGPAMLRSAAKNYESVAVVCDPRFYNRLGDELKESGGVLSPATLEALAVEVFRRTSAYEAAIAAYLSSKLRCFEEVRPLFPETLDLRLRRAALLRYGENPHQAAALYQEGTGARLVTAKQLSGKELSFNNYLDLDAAFSIARDFKDPCACIVKHTNPTGVAVAKDLKGSYERAHASDPLSAFGGIIGFNRRLDSQTAQAILKSGFMECVIAPGFDEKALALLQSKKNLRLLEADFSKKASPAPALDFKKIDGGFLAQEEDRKDFAPSELKVVTRKKPTKKDLTSLLFAWKVVKHVKSNAIVISSGTETLGIGMGQTSRVDAVFMAVRRAGTRARGAVLASDAFFPKPDSIALARRAGIRAIIQPGGSMADEDVVKAADRAGIAMVVTGLRHFKH